MTDVFISYSRRDKVFTQKLVDALQSANREVWADWASIPAASDWDAEIKEGIEKTNTVLFVLSPEWIKSNECRKEMVHAVKMGKRLVPILHIMPAEGQEVPPELAKLNWVYMRETDDFDKAFETLQSAMDTDLDWIKTHTRIQVRALEWEKKNRSASFTLRGEDLTEGEQFLASGAEKSPAPTHLQSEYVLASRKDATRRQRQALAGVTVALVVSIALSIYAVIQQRKAETQATISKAGELAALAISEKDKQFDLALLFGAESFQTQKSLFRPQNVLFLLNDLYPGLDMFLYRHAGRVQSVAFSSDGRFVASASRDGYIIIWDMIVPDKPTQILNLHEYTSLFSNIAFSPNGKYVAWGNMDETINLLDLSDTTDISKLTPSDGIPAGDITNVAFSPDGKYLASSSFGGPVRLWNITDTGNLSQIINSKPILGNSVAFSPDGKLLATGQDDGSIILLDINQPENPKELSTLLSEKASQFTSIAFSADGTFLVSGLGDSEGTVILWDINDITAPFPEVIGTNRSYLSNIAISPADNYIAWGTKDEFSISLYDLNSNKDPLKLLGQGTFVTSVAFNTSGDQIVSGGNDGSVILWDILSPILSTPLQLNDLSALTADMNFSNKNSYGTAVTSDGKLKASAVDGMITLLVNDIPTKTSPFDTGLQSVYALALSEDGTLLASGNAEGLFLLWDISNPDNPTLLSQIFAQQAVHTLSFNPNTTQLAAGLIGEIILFDVSDPTTPLILGTISSRPDMLYQALKFSQDGKILASKDLTEEVVFWDLDPESWFKKSCQRAGRNFTREEWIKYFPNIKYHKTCPQWD